MRQIGLFIFLAGLFRFVFYFNTIQLSETFLSISYFIQFLFVFSQLILSVSGFALQYHKIWALILSFIVCIFCIIYSFTNSWSMSDLDIVSFFIFIALISYTRLIWKSNT